MKPSLTWLSFLTGTTVMAAEMAASRLVAPYFGSSTPVWAALISIVLGGMALGAHLGGRAVDRLGRLEPLLAALCAVAAHLALLPFLARVLLPGVTTSVLAGQPLAGVGRVLLFTLAAVPPLLVLGAVGPFLLRVGLGGVQGAGAHAGSLSAASTTGSIVGTLVAAFAALPLLGTARTMALFALLLGAVASLGLHWRWRLLALCVPALALALGPLALPHHPRALEVAESPYAYVQALAHPDGSRELVFDEGFAVQSLWKPGQPVSQEVFAHYMLVPAMERETPHAPRVLLLGLGAGTSARGLLETYPGAQVVGVELDPEVVRLARAHFALSPEVEVHVGDARAFLAGDTRRYDAIIVDAFRFPYVPFHLTTREFMQAVAEHLAPGGIACFNVGRYLDEYAVVDAVGATLATVFPEVRAADARNRSNTLLFAGPPGLGRRLAANIPTLPEHLRALAFRVSTELRPVRAGAPLSDDHAPVELLTDGILLRAMLRGGGPL
ncbi:spermidine synthase [Vitiosangium sp. GDMCC 1.1324]|uniref:spermidine synthase n=1 Tax=Vitiosangium sp. (strain GDMCC 1.1324) TaxID=2138576 RepID=UPI000D3D3FFD|nr:fused MFS/spermidine synthase [Vitiosangium sp. GDMCC 1.1324]PTL84713.1 spermidine synthase [Vitiosangium sp. GDMCC 1.1324]